VFAACWCTIMILWSSFDCAKPKGSIWEGKLQNIQITKHKCYDGSWEHFFIVQFVDRQRTSLKESYCPNQYLLAPNRYVYRPIEKDDINWSLQLITSANHSLKERTAEVRVFYLPDHLHVGQFAHTVAFCG